MSHAWTPVALRVLCAGGERSSRTRPLLQLFTGFARQHHIQSLGRKNEWDTYGNDNITIRAQRRSSNTPLSFAPARTFSTTDILSSKKKPKHAKPQSTLRPPPPLSPSGLASSKLQPAQKVASHTEGLTPATEGSQLVEEKEELTWRDYDPLGGMPLPSGELSQREIDGVFGAGSVSSDTGNYILSVLHWRRMSGALIDVGLDFPKESQVSQEQALRGLQFIRGILPNVDEQGNGQVWANEESHRLQEEMQARAIKLGIYKAEPEDEPAEEETQGTEHGRQRSGQSVLETVRKAKEAQYEQELAEKKAAQDREEIAALHSIRGPLELDAGVQPETKHLVRTESGGVSIQEPRSNAWLQPVERKPWVKYYEEQATIIKSQSVPLLSTLQRLGPSFLTLMFVLGACYYLSENYTPPPKSARLWSDVAPSVATLYALTGVLLTTFILGRIPPLWRTYSKYMTLVPAYPYAVAMVGAGLRHDTVLHLASNLISLWLFGLLLHEDVGRGNFLAIYFASGALGGFASLTYNVLRKQWMSYIFGSSGCVLGVAAAACTLRPNSNLQLFGYDIPIAAWVFLALFTGGEVVAAVRGVKTTIDHAGHLGGIFGGVAAGAYLRQVATLRKRESGATTPSPASDTAQ